MAENPFIFGKIVKGAHFCNRKKEISELLSLAKSKNSLVIVSPRRYGKSSLIISALDKGGLDFIYIDLAGLSSKEELVERILLAYKEAKLTLK